MKSSLQKMRRSGAESLYELLKTLAGERMSGLPDPMSSSETGSSKSDISADRPIGDDAQALQADQASRSLTFGPFLTLLLNVTSSRPMCNRREHAWKIAADGGRLSDLQPWDDERGMLYYRVCQSGS